MIATFLAACTPKPPIVDPPVDPVPDPPVFRGAELYVDYMVLGTQNRFLWTFDPETLEVITVPHAGLVRFYVQDGPTLSFDLERGMDKLVFSVGDKDFSYSLRFLPHLEDLKITLAPLAAPGLILPVPGIMPVIDDEVVLLTLRWPYDPELVEETLLQSMGDHIDKLEWVDESSLVFTVSGALGDLFDTGLAQLDPMPGFTSAVGNVPLPDYRMQIMPQAEVRAVNTGSGRVTTWPLPYYVERAISYNPAGELICAQRYYELSPDWVAMDDNMHEFTFSLRDGSLSGAPMLSTPDFPYSRRWMYEIVKLEWPENADSFSHVGFSRQRDMVASIFCSDVGNQLLIHEMATGQRTLYPLQSAAWRGGSGKPADPLLWSRDGRYVFYVPDDDSNPTRLMAFDRDDETEFFLHEGDVTLVATSDFADEVLYHVDGSYFLHNLNGSRRALTGLKGEYSVVSWLSATSFLATDGEKSLIYDVWTNRATWEAPGTAIGYTAETRTVWVFGY
jgi:hypothetical protein